MGRCQLPLEPGELLKQPFRRNCSSFGTGWGFVCLELPFIQEGFCNGVGQFFSRNFLLTHLVCCSAPPARLCLHRWQSFALLPWIFWVVEAGLGEPPLPRIAKTEVASWCCRGASAKVNAGDGLGEPEPPELM